MIGLDYPTLISDVPALIYTSITGFGTLGPYGQWPGYDQIAQGMSGMMSITGTADGLPTRLGVPLADLVAGMAERKGCTSAQLALAWLLAQGEDIVPIPGTKQSKYLRDNVGAAEVMLSAADLADIEAGLAERPVSGARYTAEGMKGVDA